MSSPASSQAGSGRACPAAVIKPGLGWASEALEQIPPSSCFCESAIHLPFLLFESDGAENWYFLTFVI